MKLKTNSISSKLYRYFYGTNYLPDNLCEYFWKLVVAYIFIVPIGIICLPIVLIQIYKSITKQFYYHDLNIIEKFLFSFLIYLSLFLTVSMLSPIGLFFIPLEKDSFFEFLFQMGIKIWIITIAVSIIFGIIKLVECYYQRKYNNPRKSSILKEYIKAKKNKYCPKIDWE